MKRGEEELKILKITAVALVCATLLVASFFIIAYNSRDRIAFAPDYDELSVAMELSSGLSNGVSWTIQDLPATNAPAEGNNGAAATSYFVNLTLLPAGMTGNLYIRTTGDLLNGSSSIPAASQKFNFNQTNPMVPGNTRIPLTTTNQLIAPNVRSGTIYFKFYMDVPAGQAPGDYLSNIQFTIEPNIPNIFAPEIQNFEATAGNGAVTFDILAEEVPNENDLIHYMIVRGTDQNLVSEINDSVASVIMGLVLENPGSPPAIPNLIVAFFANSSGGTPITWFDEGVPAVENGVTYHYVLMACDEAINCATAYVFDVTPEGAASSGPTAPSGLIAGEGEGEVTHNSITLFWQDNSDDELGFIIERSSEGSSSGFIQVGQTGPGGATYKDSGLTPGQKYWYRVAAYNDEGNSGYSNIATQHAYRSVAINLAPVGDASSEFPFVDLWKQSRDPVSHGLNSTGDYVWDVGIALPRDHLGWVTSIPSCSTMPCVTEAGYVIIAPDTYNQFPPGDYVLRWDGNGTFALGVGGGTLHSCTPGRCVITKSHSVPTPPTSGHSLPGGNFFHVKITSIDPANYPKNIRLYMPGYENSGETFNPAFLEDLAPFSTLRFMDWQQTNGNLIQNWTQRTTPAHSTQARIGYGVAIEHMIELANELDKDLWITIPHMANDVFVTRYAQAIKDNLEPELNVYVEYSNEMWNNIFDQYSYAVQKGGEQGLGGGSSHTEAMRFYSKRSVEVFNIFNSVFGSESGRVKRVLAGQNIGAANAETIIDYNNAYLNADYYATAPYFGSSLGAPGGSWDVATNGVITPNPSHINQLLDVDLPASMVAPLQSAIEGAAYANSRGLGFITYEAGQHLAGYLGTENNQGLTNLFVAVNRDVRMGSLYEDYSAQLCDMGAEMIAFFNFVSVPSKWGSWGLKEHLTTPDFEAHKYRAVYDYIHGEGVCEFN